MPATKHVLFFRPSLGEGGADRVQLAIDISASRLSETPASGGVDAMPGTGWEFSYYPQLVVSGLFANGDVGTVGVRYFDGSLSDPWSLIVNERYPLTPRLRILPRLRVERFRFDAPRGGRWRAGDGDLRPHG